METQNNIDMLEINSIRTGDRLLVNGTSKLSKMIQKNMKKYAAKNGIPKMMADKFTFSHAGTFVWIDNTLFVFESVANGFKPRQFEETYDINRDHMMIVRPIRRYTLLEEYKLKMYALNLVEWSNFYQYWGLLAWKFYIATGIDLFGKGNKFSTMCYESTYRLMNHVRKGEYDKNAEKATCYDIADVGLSYTVYLNDPRG